MLTELRCQKQQRELLFAGGPHLPQAPPLLDARERGQSGKHSSVVRTCGAPRRHIRASSFLTAAGPRFLGRLMD